MFSKPTRIAVTFSFAALCTCLIAVAQTPDPPHNRIRQALEGNLPDKGTGDGTGDGVLDDVIDIIKQRGSVLDGSVLDGSSLDEGSAGQDKQTVDRSDRAAVAEQLLKASRLLERLGEADRSRRLLIKQIRDEAAKLLSE